MFDAAAARVDRGGDALRRALEAASLAGEPFAIETIAGATALSAFELAEAFERAEELQLVVGVAGGLRFAHDIVRQALVARLSSQRRRLLHARLADAAERPGADPAIVGEHLDRAGQPARAVGPWLRAASRAAERWADATPSRCIAGRSPPASTTSGAGGSARPWRGCMRAATKPSRRWLRLRRQSRWRSACPTPTAPRWPRSSSPPSRCSFIASTMPSARLDDLAARPGLAPSTRARIELGRCEAWLQQGRHDEAPAPRSPFSRCSTPCPRPARRRRPGPAADSREAWALRRDAHSSLTALAHLGHNANQGVAHAEAMRDACARLGDEPGLGRAERSLGVMRLAVDDDPARARFHLEASRRIAAAERDVAGERMSILNLIKIAADAGDADQVLALADAGWNLSSRFARAFVRQAFHFAFLYAHGLRGELGLALDRAAMVRAEAEGSDEFLSSSTVADQLSDLYLGVGDPRTVHALLDAVPPAPGAGTFHRLRIAVARARAHWFAGDTAAARQAIEAWAGDDADLPVEGRVRLALHRAELAIAEGRPTCAADALAAAQVFPNRELALTAAGLRLRLASARAVDAAAEAAAAIAHARRLLIEGRAPVWFILDLRVALVGGLAASGLGAEAARERAAVAADLQRLAATLGPHGDRRDAFLARYPLP